MIKNLESLGAFCAFKLFKPMLMEMFENVRRKTIPSAKHSRAYAIF